MALPKYMFFLLLVVVVIFGTVASQKRINVGILPLHFLANLCWDPTQENLIPDRIEHYHCLFALSSRTDHRCLTGFDRRSKTIFYLDPLGKDYRETQNASQHINIMEKVVMEHVIGATKGTNLSDHQWSVVTATDFSHIFNFEIPLQLLSKDCRIFCLLYAFYLMFHKTFDFSQNDMVFIRFRLLTIIKDCAVSPVVLDYINNTTCNFWLLLSKARLKGINIGMLPNEMLVNIFEEVCKNKYEVSLLKKVCENWKNLLDENFEFSRIKRNLLDLFGWLAGPLDKKSIRNFLIAKMQ